MNFDIFRITISFNWIKSWYLILCFRALSLVLLCYNFLSCNYLFYALSSCIVIYLFFHSSSHQLFEYYLILCIFVIFISTGVWNDVVFIYVYFFHLFYFSAYAWVLVEQTLYKWLVTKQFRTWVVIIFTINYSLIILDDKFLVIRRTRNIAGKPWSKDFDSAVSS